MSCKLTYDGQRFDDKKQITQHINELPIKNKRKITSSSTLDFIQKRSIYQDQLLAIFDPQTLLEVSQSVGNLATHIIDIASNRPEYSKSSRENVIKSIGNDAIFQGIFINLSNTFFNILTDISLLKKPLNNKNIKIIKTYSSLFSIPIEDILTKNKDGHIILVDKIRLGFNGLQDIDKQDKKLYSQELKTTG